MAVVDHHIPYILTAPSFDLLLSPYYGTYNCAILPHIFFVCVSFLDPFLASLVYIVVLFTIPPTENVLIDVHYTPSFMLTT